MTQKEKVIVWGRKIELQDQLKSLVYSEETKEQFHNLKDQITDCNNQLVTDVFKPVEVEENDK